MTIRTARAGDDARIAHLAGQLGYPASEEEVRRRREGIEGDPHHRLFVADLPEVEVAGWAHVFFYPNVQSEPRVEVAALVVDEGCRGRGVGKALMARTEQWAAESGCDGVSLRSNVIRDGAHRFYRKLGYSIVKTQHAFRRKLPRRGE